MTFFRFQKVFVNHFGDLVMFKSFIKTEYQIFAGSIFSNVRNGCSPLFSIIVSSIFLHLGLLVEQIEHLDNVTVGFLEIVIDTFHYFTAVDRYELIMNRTDSNMR